MVGELWGLTALSVSKYHLLIKQTTSKQVRSSQSTDGPVLIVNSLGFIKTMCMDVLELWDIPFKKYEIEIACFRKWNLSSLTLPLCSLYSPSFWPRSCLTSWPLTSTWRRRNTLELPSQMRRKYPCVQRRENMEPEIALSQLSAVKAAAGHLGLAVQGQSKFTIWISKALWSCLEQPKDIIRVMLILWNY